MLDRSDPVPRNRKADADQVIQRYQELRNLRRTGEEFGITRERVRQIVNEAGVSTYTSTRMRRIGARTRVRRWAATLPPHTACRPARP